MKLLLQFALALLCLISTSSNSQSISDSQLRDTVFVSVDKNTKVLFLSLDIMEVHDVALDSIINLLIADWKTALSRGADKESIHNYYIISESGKRRLKLETPDFIESDFNVELERKELELGLSGTCFRIYNFQDKYECWIYIDDLEKLQNAQLDNAIEIVLGNKKIKRKNYRFDIGKDERGWVLLNQYRWVEDLLEFEAFFGVGLLGSTWSPANGYNLNFTFTNKYAIPFFRLKLGYKGYVIPGKEENSFSGLSYLNSGDFGFMMNASGSRKPKWFGLSAGVFNATDTNYYLHKKWRISIESQVDSHLYITFDLIPVAKKKNFAAVSFLIPF